MWKLIILSIVKILLWKVILRRKYWPNLGVTQTRYGFIFGDNWGHILRKKSFAQMMQTVYSKFPNARYFGYYHFTEPIFIPRDPDLIKDIMAKDFDHFVNHMSFFPEDDPFFSRNLFSQKDQTWREMRVTLTPLFTTSKMKYMFTLFTDICQNFVQHFLDRKKDVILVEMKDVFTKFANDVIANVAFGTECDSIKSPNNEFYLMSRDLTEIKGAWKSLKLFGYFLVPKLYKLFNISPFSKNAREFFVNLVKKNISNRQKNNISRPDMINILLEARKHGLKIEESSNDQDTSFATVKEVQINSIPTSHKSQISDEEITSQAVAFLFAGFESVSSLMCFMAYELGVNPDIQEKLLTEIEETKAIHGDKITYGAISSMKYMDLVVTESLRKWSSSIVINRVCTKTYTIEPRTPEEKPVVLEKGAIVWIPVFGLLRDPNFYPDPDKFDPERFNDDNKGQIHPCTFLPFGYGPRSCIGSRFALLETKTLFFYLLSNFQIVPTGKTQIPLQLSKIQMNLTAEDGFWLSLKKRLLQ